MQSTEINQAQRSGADRRHFVDSRNPELQIWMREFWSKFYRDNPEKERRVNPDRRRQPV
jgi:hypothetical protein